MTDNGEKLTKRGLPDQREHNNGRPYKSTQYRDPKTGEPEYKERHNISITPSGWNHFRTVMGGIDAIERAAHPGQDPDAFPVKAPKAKAKDKPKARRPRGQSKPAHAGISVGDSEGIDPMPLPEAAGSGS